LPWCFLPQLLKIVCDGAAILPVAGANIEEGDTLVVQGRIENLMKVRKIEGIRITGALDLDAPEIRQGKAKIVEVLLARPSELLGRTLKETHLRERFGLSVLAIFRDAKSLRERFADVRFRVGDILLPGGAENRVDSLRCDPGMVILDEHKMPMERSIQGFLLLLMPVFWPLYS
jgi:uncharacterized protein with PhoU and TrkA domain